MPLPLSQENRQEWKEKICNQRASGLSIERWCRENHVASHSFYYWRDKLFPKPTLSSNAFIELAEEKEKGVSLEFRGARFQLNRGFDAHTLKQVLELLQEIKC